MSQFDELPESWAETTLKDIVLSIQYGHTASAQETRVGPRILRITDLQNNSVNWESVPFCICEDIEKYALQEGDIVIARTGATTGKSFYSVVGTYGVAAIINTESIFCIQRNTALLKPCRIIDTYFLLYVLQSHLVKSQADRIATGTSQKLITLTNLSRIKVLIAPIDEQHLIVDKVESILNLFQAVQESQNDTYAELEIINQSILAKAFRGELVPQDPNDEPAAVLLERIRAEREKGGGERGRKKGRE